MLVRFMMIFIMVFSCSRQEASQETQIKHLGVEECAASMTLVAEVLSNADHACHDWVVGTYGRVVKSAVGSATIIQIAPAELIGKTGEFGVLFSARHVVGSVSPGAECVLDPLTVWDPFSFAVIGTYPEINLGAAYDYKNSMVTGVMYATATEPSDLDEKARLTKIAPRRDFVIGLTSSTRYDFAAGQLANPDMDFSVPFHLHDINNGAKSALARPKESESAIIIGFPNEYAPAMVFSVGEILSDTEGASIIASSEDAEEKAMPYDAESEFVVAAKAMSGMSGGAVFDRKGRYLGITVRGSTVGSPFTRVVKAEFVLQSVAQHQEIMKYLNHLEFAN